jgi:hypothetical protein
MLRIAELVNIQEEKIIEEKINKQAEKTAKLLHRQGEAAERKSKKQLKLVHRSLFSGEGQGNTEEEEAGRIRR